MPVANPETGHFSDTLQRPIWIGSKSLYEPVDAESEPLRVKVPAYQTEHNSDHRMKSLVPSRITCEESGHCNASWKSAIPSPLVSPWTVVIPGVVVAS